MTGKREDDLHGNVPDDARTALLLIDVINDMEWEGGEALFPDALDAAHQIRHLAEAARSAGIPVIYANDNFGQWRSDFRSVVQHCLGDGVRGAKIARLLEPRQNDYFVLKPKHSAFHATPLDTLLEYLGARRLILAGYSADICVLLTAGDAHMRDYALAVPEDCVATAEQRTLDATLDWLERICDADTRPWREVELEPEA